MGGLATSSGAVGAAISGDVASISSCIKLANGEIDGGEFAGNVAKETVGGSLSATVGSLAATAAAAGTATLLAATTAPAWIPPAVGVGAAIAAGSVVKCIYDGIRDFLRGSGGD